MALEREEPRSKETLFPSPCRCPLQALELVLLKLVPSTLTCWPLPVEVSWHFANVRRQAQLNHHHLLARHGLAVAMGWNGLLVVLPWIEVGLAHACLLLCHHCPCHHKWKVCLHDEEMAWSSYLRSPCLRSNRSVASLVVCIVHLAQIQLGVKGHMHDSLYMHHPCHMLHSCHGHRHSPAVESVRSSPMVVPEMNLHVP